MTLLSRAFLLLFPLTVIGTSLIVNQLWSDIRWEHYPFHAFVEGLGAFTALCIAVLICILQKNNQLPIQYLWVSSGLSKIESI